MDYTRKNKAYNRKRMKGWYIYMADYSYSSEVVLSELLRISKNFIWKNPTLALEGETNVDSIVVEQYNLAVQGKLTFDLVYAFDKEALMNAGFPEEEAVLLTDTPSAIPVEKREYCAQKETEWLLENYVEKNNYYRMLNGLPDLEDTDYFYNTDYPEISDSLTPIHELDVSQLYSLEGNGYLDKLKEKYPDKKYLDHLTSKKIDIYTARNSSDYAILWIAQSSFTTLITEFKETYNACRYMVMNIYYMKNMKSENTEYTGFIGMVILFATINQIQRKMLDADITRDFFDEESLQYVYDSYGVPFYSQIPIEYHRKIVKNMNILLSHKGSTRVFYDIFDVFGFDAMSVFEYYMMKIHRFENGKPVFYKNEDGSYNLREMYNVIFSKVQLYNDPTMEMIEGKNHVSYSEMVQDDPYWITDKDLLDKIYSEEYNFMESKYLGIQTTFNLMKIIYESCYYFKMIIDNRKTLEGTSVYNNNIHGNSNIFDLVIYACALITKKYGYEGNIPTDPHEIGKVMGFNFKEDLTVLKNNITKNDYLKNDAKLLQYLETMNVNSLVSIEKVYTNMTALRSYLTEKMAETREVDEYWAYYELYQTMMYSEYVDDVFTKTDGDTAVSFADMLEDINPGLYERYIQDDKYDIDSELSDTLFLLKKSCKKLKYLEYADNVNIDNIVEYMFKLLDYFKSEKAALTGYEITYSLVSRSENVMKLLDLISHIEDDYSHDPQYSIIDELYDFILLIIDRMKILSVLILDDDIPLIYDEMTLQDMIDYLQDYIAMLVCIVYDMTSHLELYDEIDSIKNTFYHNEPFTFDDSVALLFDYAVEVMKYFLEDEFPFFDIIPFIANIIYAKDDLSTEKLIFTWKLTMATVMHIDQTSDLHHVDEIPLIKSHGKISSEITDPLYEKKTTKKSRRSKVLKVNPEKYVDVIVKIFKKLKIFSNMPTDDLIQLIKHHIRVLGESKMPMDDVIPLQVDITDATVPTQKDICEMFDEIMHITADICISDDHTFAERLTMTSKPMVAIVSENYMTDEISSKELKTVKCNGMTFEDSIILKKETREE